MEPYIWQEVYNLVTSGQKNILDFGPLTFVGHGTNGKAYSFVYKDVKIIVRFNHNNTLTWL